MLRESKYYPSDPIKLPKIEERLSGKYGWKYWERNVRHCLDEELLESLIDTKSPTPKEGDANFEKWERASVAVGKWLIDGLSTEARKDICSWVDVENADIIWYCIEIWVKEQLDLIIPIPESCAEVHSGIPSPSLGWVDYSDVLRRTMVQTRIFGSLC